MGYNTSVMVEGTPIHEVNRQDRVSLEVPLLVHRPGWCGAAGSAMLSQYRDRNISPVEVFNDVQRVAGKPLFTEETEYDPEIQTEGPNIGALAESTARLLEQQGATNLRVNILTKKFFDAYALKFGQLHKEKPLPTPHTVMQAYLRGGTPFMIRTPGHFRVITGFDLSEEVYFSNSPYTGKEVLPMFRGKKNVEDLWSSAEQGYPNYSARYLAMIIRAV